MHTRPIARADHGGHEPSTRVPPPSSLRLTLADASPGSLAGLRGLVRSFLHQSGRVEACADAALVVTELAANAILHSTEPVRVFLQLTDNGVLAAVHDGDPDQPPGAGDQRERGLGIIGALSGGRWGITWDDDGKWVWAELRR